MADRVRLDTRPRRHDLTSRECCSILGGVIGGMIQVWGVATTRDLVRAFVKIFLGDWANLDDLEGRPGSKEMAAILGATMSALDENATKGAAADGFIWWAERTDAEWDQVVSQGGHPA